MPRPERSLKLPEFGRNLAHAMGEKRLSQEALRLAVGVNQGTVSRWLGGALPNRETLERVAATVGRSWQWLLTADTGEVPMKITPSGTQPSAPRARDADARRGRRSKRKIAKQKVAS